MGAGRTQRKASISASAPGLNDPVTAYARAVDAGEIIAGPFVRAACRRHLGDLETGEERGLRWNLELALHRIAFFPDCLTVEGEVEGQDGDGVIPFELMPEQKFIVGSLFGWQRREGDKWFRRFNQAYIEGGKGSGKTPLAAGIGLAMMLDDDELSAEVYSAGSKKEQAMILFGDAVAMAQRSPEVRALHLVFSGKNPVWQITDRSTNSKFKPLSSDKLKSGQRVHAGLVDELHEHKDRYTVDMLKAGFKRRKQPLLFIITNSGFDRESICWEWHEHAIAVAEGLRLDDKIFSYVMAVDDADDPLEDLDLIPFGPAGDMIPRCWLKTNPGLGRTVTVDYLRGQVADARQIPGRENGVRRLNFCQWTDADVGWVTRNAWVSCEEELTAMRAPPKKGSLMGGGSAIGQGLEGAELYIGLDLAFAFDLAALAFVFPEKGKEGEPDRFLAWVEYFTPIDTCAKRETTDRVPYQEWIRRGLIHGCDGSIIRKKHIAARIAEVSGRFDLVWGAYDRYRHKELADEMHELGVDVPWIEHPQGFRRGGVLDGQGGNPRIVGPDGKPIDNPLWMPDSLVKLEARILEKTIVFQPSPVTRWQVSGAAIKQDPAGTGNRVFDKRKAVGRIDGIVALAMAVGAAEMKLPKMDLSGFLANPVRTK